MSKYKTCGRDHRQKRNDPKVKMGMTDAEYKAFMVKRKN